MNRYLNLSGNSPISHYEIGNDFIIVKFNNGRYLYYIYTNSGKAGKNHVDIMKSLAIKEKD